MAQKKDNNKQLLIVALFIGLAVGTYFYFRPKKKNEIEVLKDVFDNLTFETGKAIIKDNSFASLDDLVNVLKKAPNWKLKIVGHTDNQGSESTNLMLSKKRAEAVKNYLLKSGIVNEVVTDGFGESKPIASNTTPEGREKNRRVEFTIVKPDKSEIEVTK
jgi:outer membrane protein OmpA-like peptidoglycan-associated protein